MIRVFDTKFGLKTIQQIYSEPEFKDIIKVCRGTFNERVVYKGWDWEKALTTPPLKQRRKGINTRIAHRNRGRRVFV
jgi:hypothetical protein